MLVASYILLFQEGERIPCLLRDSRREEASLCQRIYLTFLLHFLLFFRALSHLFILWNVRMILYLKDLCFSQCPSGSFTAFYYTNMVGFLVPILVRTSMCTVWIYWKIYRYIKENEICWKFGICSMLWAVDIRFSLECGNRQKYCIFIKMKFNEKIRIAWTKIQNFISYFLHVLYLPLILNSSIISYS